MERREFVKKSALGVASLSIVSNSILGSSHGHAAPSDKLNIAAVGIGGKGFVDIKSVDTENIVALCDVDWDYSKRVFDAYPKAERYRDYRRMFDRMGKGIDAVVVATPDHTHAIVTADAITLGKHVYTEKPLTHSVYESRLLTKLAAEYNVATQMGNQRASGEAVNLICEWIWNGEIGEVTKVEAFTDRPIWPQGLMPPEKADEIPSTLDWDLFTGPAELKPFSRVYHPWNWRGWWNYGTGAFGDMACHILDPVFKSLKLKYPIKVQGSSTLLLQDCAPQAQHVRMVYPRRDNMPKVGMPEVEIHWYDGGMKPIMPEGFPKGKPWNVPGMAIFHGTRDTMIFIHNDSGPFLLSGRMPNAPKVCRRITEDPVQMAANDKQLPFTHGQDWVRACKESSDSRVRCNSDFSVAGPLNEMVVMGVLGVRLQALERDLEWDGENMRFTNIGEDETIRMVIRDGFKVTNGHPRFDKIMSDPVNAQQFANKIIKRDYREGWKLPDMPK